MAAPLDLADAAAQPWASASAAFAGALVYLDDGAASAAAAAGGAALLLGLGAAAVCDLRQPRPSVRRRGAEERRTPTHARAQDGEWARAEAAYSVVCVLTRPLSEAQVELAAVVQARRFRRRRYLF